MLLSLVFKTYSSDNQPPIIHGPAEVKAECGKVLEFQVSATDPNNDTLSYMVSGLPAGATFDNNTATFTWNATNADNVSIIVLVNDKLGASTQQDITIDLCCCQNNAECLYNQTIAGKGTETFRFMGCNCTALYDGDFCENERDPCADKPCYDDTVTCTKSPSNENGYTCSACPQGLTGNGEDCAGTFPASTSVVDYREKKYGKFNIRFNSIIIWNSIQDDFCSRAVITLKNSLKNLS